MNYSFDASSFIYLWDNYPYENDHFKSLWDAFKKKFKNKTFFISDVALEEVRKKIPNFKETFPEIKAEIKKTIADLDEVQKIKNTLGIEEDEYGKGVGENDLLIIAITKRNKYILVSEEKIQIDLSKTKKQNYKIPAVCKEIAKIECCNIVSLLKEKKI